jgi:hypothetical protein
MPVKGTDNNRYIYDLPTVDDPERANTAEGGDINDPFGGNDGLNQAKLVPGGPVQIFAVGYRNAYDIVITKTAGKEGRMYTVDNGPNRGWGGYPENENSPDVTNNYPPDEPGSIRDGEDDESVNNLDNLHLVYKEGMKEPWYGGHPTPIRANPASAGLFWKNKEGEHFSLTPTVDWPPVPVEMANPIESDFRGPGIDDGYLSTFDHSTNGLTEYSATGFFDGAMAGDLVAASFNGAIYRTKLNKAGTRVLFQEVLAEGFAFLPLDVVAQSDNDVFPGTIWVADFQGNSIYVLDPVTVPQWNEYQSEDNSAPTARHEASFVKAGGKFYLLGGRGKLPVNQYDPATRRWSSVSPIPGNPELNHFQAVTLDDKIYIVGAFTGEFPVEKPVPDIYVYDPATDQWEVRRNIIPPARQRGSAAAVAYENKIYIVAGSTNGHTNGFVSWTDVYDPATNTWTSLPDTPHARDHFQAAVLDGKLYAIGGRRSNFAEDKTFEDMEAAVDVFDFANNSWKTLPTSANIPTLRAGAATVTFEDRILIIGGESTQPKAHNTVEAFIPATESWATYPPLITGRHGTQAIVYDNHVYVAAGSGNQGGSPELATMERFTPGTIIHCTGMNNSTSLDDDGDGYSNKDEIDNGTNPCSPASKPGDFDQDMLSDLRDQDDDADNIPDNRDALHLDASNGRDNKLPLHYPFLNGDPGKGLFGLGFTGLMHNANQDPAQRYQANADGLIMGGAAGMATVPANGGLAITNDLEHGFQFGIAVDSSYLGFRVESRLVGPYFKAVPLDALKDEIQGIFVGTGDQDNYVAISITPNANNAGIQIWVEDGGNLTVDTFHPVPGLLAANIFLILEIDMTTGLVQAKYKLEANLAEVTLGTPFKIGDALLQEIKNSQAAAVGLMASSRNGTPFSATWDFLNIDPILNH